MTSTFSTIDHLLCAYAAHCFSHKLNYLLLGNIKQPYLDYISQAEDAADTLGSPMEKGILLYVKSKIAAIKPDDFTESSSHYLAESNSLLCNIPGETVKF